VFTSERYRARGESVKRTPPLAPSDVLIIRSNTQTRRS
jgi:hypothetical protein